MSQRESAPASRETLIARYRRNRARSAEVFALLSDDAYYSQPIALRHPIVFYDGHLPGFSFNTLVKKGLAGPSIDPALEKLFARGIDPHEAAGGSAPARWPTRDEVRAFASEADRRVIDALTNEELDRPGHPLLDGMEAVFAILEHEEMHQETLLYMWHRLPFGQKRPPREYQPRTVGAAPRREWITIPAGRATLGVDRSEILFGWDNEQPSYSVEVAPFAIERHDVTNELFMEFVEAGGYRNPSWWSPPDWQWVRSERREHPLFWEQDSGRWWWRGMFDRIALPPGWPVYVSHAEASAFARWDGTRLPTEAEFQRAAFGSSSGQQTAPRNGNGGAAPPGVFDFVSWDPQPAGSHPRTASAWGVEDLIGNGWEWTSTPFAPFPGFTPIASYPEYSADFFDGEHMVMKGASPVTARELLRPTFRNWFRTRYPYVYATFRTVRHA
jgi:ergothioneine biosynthesis protein EgtB